MQGDMNLTDDVRSEDQPLPPCSIPASCQISFRGIPEGVEWQEKFIAIARKVVEASGCHHQLNEDIEITVKTPEILHSLTPKKS